MEVLDYEIPVDEEHFDKMLDFRDSLFRNDILRVQLFQF